jgi:hypothetical protein
VQANRLTVQKLPLSVGEDGVTVEQAALRIADEP